MAAFAPDFLLSLRATAAAEAFDVSPIPTPMFHFPTLATVNRRI